MRLYLEYCAMQRIRPPVPATLESLVCWVAELGTRKLLPKTIKAYLTGVKSSHIDMGFTNLDIFHNPMLERIIRGIQRLRGDANTKERQPITRDILLKILTQFDVTTREGATLHAVFYLAFGGFFRMGEFTWSQQDGEQPDFAAWNLTRGSVKLYEDHLLLLLPASKTDPFRRGVSITIAATGDEACAVRSIRHLFTCFSASTSSPLFQTAAGVLFTRRLATDILREKLQVMGYTGVYSGHSFRRGAATHARNMGLSDDEIMLLGRWKSGSFRLYIDIHPDRTLNASFRHQSSRVDR